MKRIGSSPIAIAILAFGFLVAARADLSQSTILRANTSLNLDTGATGGSGGDILWNGNTITPQGSARLDSLGTLGLAGFVNLTQPFVNLLARDARPVALPANQLTPGSGFIVVTNGNHNAKVLVTANSGGLISLRLTTYGVSAPAGVPVLNNVLNNSSQVQPGHANSGIAPSSIFIVQGTGLADPTEPVLQSSAAPGLPLTLNGASISVTVNGVTVQPALYYTSARQIAAVLPAGTPTGTGTLTVTYRGVTSAPTPIQVVPSALGINTYFGNVGVATDATTGGLLTYNNSGSPSQTIVLWTTGLGANPADSDTTFTTTPHSVNTPLQIYIGGVPATILYQGSAGYPGVNQINLTIPPNVPTGCWVSVAAATGTVVSNVATLPINNGGGACFDALTGLNGNQISPTEVQTLRTGLVSLVQTTRTANNGTRTVANSANGAFVRYTGLYVPNRAISAGGCLLVQDFTPVPIPGITGLDTGSITLSRPSGPDVTLAGVRGQHVAQLPAGAIPSTGGTFTFTGAGGADVGPFTATLTLSNPLLTWTNQNAAATIDRTQGLQVTWTGGNPGTFVFVTGTSQSTAGVVAGFTCLASADAGRFTVPSYILLGMPAGNGAVVVQNDIYVPLAPSGIDIGLALADISYSVPGVYR